MLEGQGEASASLAPAFLAISSTTHQAMTKEHVEGQSEALAPSPSLDFLATCQIMKEHVGGQHVASALSPSSAFLAMYFECDSMRRDATRHDIRLIPIHLITGGNPTDTTAISTPPAMEASGLGPRGRRRVRGLSLLDSRCEPTSPEAPVSRRARLPLTRSSSPLNPRADLVWSLTNTVAEFYFSVEANNQRVFYFKVEIKTHSHLCKP